MADTHPAPNEKVLQLIGIPEGDPFTAREILFWFCSKEEGALYRLASVLKRRGYRMLVRKSGRSMWICIAEGSFIPADQPLASLCMQMLELAERYEVVFETWETEDPETSSRNR